MLIAITGKKGAGKDTLAAPLVEAGFTNVKMAGPLKEMLRALYRSAGLSEDEIERKIEGDLKEERCSILCGQTPRYTMQKLGDEWRRMIGDELWTDLWGRSVEGLLAIGTPVVCTDIRYEPEAQLIRDFGGYLIRVERPGLDTTDDHLSETEMDRIQVDQTINNTGTTAELQQALIDFMKEITQ